MKRRSFAKLSSSGTLGLLLPSFACQNNTTHILTLSFDDGFKKSFTKTVAIFESHGLQACLNVMASGHFSDFTPPDPYILSDTIGDFELWNQFTERGHEIMPHGWNHTNLTKVSFVEATELIDKSLEYFQQNLIGFKLEDAVFNFPFNASNSELENYVLQKVRAVRSGGNNAINPLPSDNVKRLSCISKGPENADSWLEHNVADFIDSTGGWMVLNLHGLDGEGWGPVSSEYLDKLLKQITKYKFLKVLPAGLAINKFG